MTRSDTAAGADYEDLVPLGDGPVATVFAGVAESTGDAFALKVYPGTLGRRAQAESTGELATLRALRPKAPLLVADALETLPDGRCALRMELCAQSLPELVASSGPMTVADALALGAALAEALSVAHKAALVHGQVSPGNVLFRPSGAAVLSDFGTALRRAFPCDPVSAVESLAPETIRDGTADARTDLYGLGVVLYTALAGHSPHRARPGERPHDQVMRVLQSPPSTLRRADVPAGLAQLVSALLSTNPAARPMDVQSVVERLGALLGPVPPEPRSAAPGPPAAEPSGDSVTVTVFPARAHPGDGTADVVVPPGQDGPQAPAAAAPAQAPDTAQPGRAEAGSPPAPSGALAATTVPVAHPYRPGEPRQAPEQAGHQRVGPPPGPRPAGDPVLVFGPDRLRGRLPEAGVLVSAGLALALVVVVAAAVLLVLS